MNKSESKYFNTAIKMDKAFLDLLAEKDFEYITVKEICKRADVNRSTFYLHYETIADLLNESVEYISKDFQKYFSKNDIISKINSLPLEELIFIKPDYIIPYLSYVKDNKKLFQTAVLLSGTLQFDKAYKRMFEYIFSPILMRFDIPENERQYTMAFYINGIIALIMEWLKNDCRESVEDIADIIIRNIKSAKL